jgi:CheY-like chemotaxis protein
MRTYKIIIVENDEDEQFFMKEGFNAVGLFQIMAQLNSGDELLEWLNDHPGSMPDLILSDLNMPGKNGYDVIADMKATSAYAQVPVIITSTSSTRTIIEKCLALGAADYIVKPDTFVEYMTYARQLHLRIEEKALVK